MTILRESSSWRIRLVSMDLKRAFPYRDVEFIFTWNAFRDTAGTCMASMAMAIRATDTCSPVVISISSSLFFGSGLTDFAREIRSSVVSPMADSTTTTSCPSL